MRSLLKVLGILLGAVIVIALVGLALLYFLSERRIDRRYEVAVEDIAVPSDAKAIERGARVALLRGCIGCHGANLAGRTFIDDALFGHMYTPNLTSGGLGAQLSPADWERAVRHGVGHDGRSLIIMPALEFHGLGNEDLADVIAFARSVPVVEQSWPSPPRVGPIARALLVFDQADVIPAEHIDHRAPHPPKPKLGATPEYGAYLASSCTGCHKSDLAGGTIPGEGVVAANLTMDQATGIGAWSEADFVKTLRTGTRPDGRALDPVMPWEITAQMTDVELSAIWQYLKTLPALREGT
jgi:mono/diheme cytochrome c family protein